MSLGLLSLLLSTGSAPLTDVVDPGVARSAFSVAKHLPSAPNRTFSPLSAWTALRMLQGGTAGETNAELAAVLRSDAAPEFRREDEARSLRPFLALLEKDPSLSLANGLWTPVGSGLKASYADEMRRTFGAVTSEVRGDPTPVVNAWANEKTEGRIPKILARVDPGWSLVLANALLYKGKWNGPFDPKLTRSEPFHRTSGDVSVPMMHRTDRMLYGEYAGSPAVALGLRGDYALFAILPPVGEDPWAWLVAKGERAYSVGVRGFAPTKVVLSLPRFSASDELDLIPALGGAGVKGIFGGGDFSPMFARGAHFVSQIVQKTTLSLDESGAEASAVTAVVVTRSAPVRPPQEPVTMTFDRPFAYLIVHMPTRAPLLMGAFGGPGLVGK